LKQNNKPLSSARTFGCKLFLQSMECYLCLSVWQAQLSFPYPETDLVLSSSAICGAGSVSKRQSSSEFDDMTVLGRSTAGFTGVWPTGALPLLSLLPLLLLALLLSLLVYGGCWCCGIATVTAAADFSCGTAARTRHSRRCN
jgi:hypothetical protein